MENSIIEKKISDSFKRTIIYLENVMVVVCDFSNGPMEEPELPHFHSNEQITYVAEGEILFFMDGIEHQMKKGDMIAVSPGIKHCIKTLSKEVKLIDSFTPIRKDFLL
ncbi:MAG: cupin domain-containing protein [Bacteroidetes bacterium]|nr:cupin domain-containing protein [Bacteroidota bacterium]